MTDATPAPAAPAAAGGLESADIWGEECWDAAKTSKPSYKPSKNSQELRTRRRTTLSRLTSRGPALRSHAHKVCY